MSDPLSPARSSLQRLRSRARATDGSPPFSDGALVELAQGTATLLWLDEAAAVTTAGSAEFVVDPDARRRGLGTRMLELLTSQAEGEMLFWAHGDHPAARALAASHGLVAVRELLHLEAPVPAARAARTAPLAGTAPAPPVPAPAPVVETSTSAGSAGVEAAEVEVSARDGYEIGPIRLPEDAPAWLELNARAFAGHPEQGGMTRADLDTTIAEPWFDADDFLVLRDGGAIIGCCWLKVEAGSGEAGSDGALEGEFYVVGVDPDRQGQRLGQRLVEAGMARLASRGIPTAHLYVEGDNAAALRLYRGFGFTNRVVDIQYRWAARA